MTTRERSVFGFGPADGASTQAYPHHPCASDDAMDDAWDDRPREACGVFGIFDHADAAPLTALGLHALQHRGQEAAGIVTFDGHLFHAERRLGLVGDGFGNGPDMEQLRGSQAIGHVRYSTTGATILRNVQPLFGDLSSGGFAIGHNGNLTNGFALRKLLVQQGAIFQSTTDTEVILHLVARSTERGFVDRFIDALARLEGAYALVGLTRDALVGARDPLGIRPLVLGRVRQSYVLASETCALDIVGAEFIREIENGEVVVITKDGLASYHPFGRRPARPCLFEYIYFARPDSVAGGRSIYEVRKALGRELAREALAPADIVVPVPDSGVPAAIGYAQESGLPYELGIIRNHYVGRTFIQPKQAIRALNVKLKHSVNALPIRGKRVVLIDDSVVRGTTSFQIVQMVRDAGAAEVHMRIASPPIKYPDFYGIDIPDRETLLAHDRDLASMRAIIRADSLGFLSVEGLYRAMGVSARNSDQPQFTDHCFTGQYPTPLTDQSALGRKQGTSDLNDRNRAASLSDEHDGGRIISDAEPDPVE